MHDPNITFFFEGRRVTARPGQSIAGALFDAGVRVLSYSVKYRRPRGLHCARGRCIACHMEVDGVPGVPTCITPAANGMRVRREDFRPFFSPLLVWAARLLPFSAGFYYRMFTRPAFLRKLFLGSLRRMAGVGRADGGGVSHTSVGDGDRRAAAKRYDVVVVGAGLSGMSAARSAARHNTSVLLVDEYAQGGGHALGFNTDDEKTSARDELIAEVIANPSIEFLPATTAQAFYPPDTLLIGRGGSAGPAGETAGLQRVRSSSFVFATGAHDVIPLLTNNDTPGVFGSRAIRLLLERDGLRPGSRAVIYGTGSELVEQSQLLSHHGIDVVALVDGATPVPGAEDRFREGPRLFAGSVIQSVHGGEWISGVTVASPHGASGTTRVDCDLLCIAFPGQGAYELAYQSGFEFEMCDGPLAETRVMRPTTSSVINDTGISFFVVGELAGQTSWAEKIRAGEESGSFAASPRQPSPKD